MSTNLQAPGPREQLLVRSALPVLEACAIEVQVGWQRFVGSPDELYAVGTFALYRAAARYREEMNTEFEDYARRRVRGAMRDCLKIEVQQERLRRAAESAADRFLAEYRDDEFDVLKHDEEDAKKRLAVFARGVLAATFAAGIDEAVRCDGEGAVVVRQEYAHAIAALREALPKLEHVEIQTILLVYSGHKTLDEASEVLGLSYRTMRRTHERALSRLHQELTLRGVTRAPPIADVPGVGPAFPANEVERP